MLLNILKNSIPSFRSNTINLIWKCLIEKCSEDKEGNCCLLFFSVIFPYVFIVFFLFFIVWLFSFSFCWFFFSIFPGFFIYLLFFSFAVFLFFFGLRFCSFFFSQKVLYNRTGQRQHGSRSVATSFKVLEFVINTWIYIHKNSDIQRQRILYTQKAESQVAKVNRESWRAIFQIMM